ncbi:tripartite tricarboxylate transporter permease [Taklimakanibacter lacteus]|uniref:tripartite tricarboxylate transporter permease n=1 Tax=Taklimakanibacter lacteus TaxID=2268456 RepID=UPI000E65F223
MLDSSLSSLFGILFSPHMMMLMTLGVLVGLFFGIMPGLGGKLGIIFLIPFVFGMDPIPGAVFLLAMHSVVHTSGAIPSILFGIPGTGPDAATIVDGYPMTRKGEAGRALGATLCASGIGGVIGAVFLSLLLPSVEPIVLAFSPAEFFLLAVLGITFIAALSGDSLVKGLIVGLFGLIIATVGLDPVSGQDRYTFGQLFLWDGIDPVTAVIAIFAIPEMVALALRGNLTAGRSETSYSMSDVVRGCIDVFRHWFLTLRTSLIGAFIGLIPGLGGDVASWLCYGHAVQSSKTPERFGKGAVEGVIAPETANNSKEGGALLPTLYFGIPGSSGMAILLGAFVMLGIQPGPGFAAGKSDVVWALIWTLAIANILAVLLLLAMAPWLSRIAGLRTGLLIPFVIALSLLGSYLGAGAWQNFMLFLGLGALGWLFKKYDWPRPPFVIGIVLGPIAENSFHKAMALWGPAFLLRPLSLVLLAIIAATLVLYIIRARREAVAT